MSTPTIRGSGPRDGFPDYIVRSLRRDKIGILSGITLRHFKVGAVNHRISPVWIDPRQAPDPGWQIPCVDCVADVKDGLCIVTYAHEGVEPGFNPSEVQYEFDGAMEDSPIDAHPNIEQIKQKYGWDTDTKEFPEFLASATAATAGFGNKSAKQKRNPAAGLESWLSVGATYRRIYAFPGIPAGTYTGIGTVFNSPPGIEALLIGGSGLGRRNWLKLAPRIIRRGNSAEIAEEFLLSGPNGWIRAIYSAKAISGTGGDAPGSGLHSGGLEPSGGL